MAYKERVQERLQDMAPELVELSREINQAVKECTDPSERAWLIRLSKHMSKAKHGALSASDMLEARSYE